MILSRDNPHYKDLPGLSVFFGGMWVMNISYWGFNQYIIQRGLAAKSVNEAQKGIVLAAFLKLLMPVIIVLPGIAALVLVPGLRVRTSLPASHGMLPTGILGLVFAALVAAVVASRDPRSIRSPPSSRWICTARPAEDRANELVPSAASPPWFRSSSRSSSQALPRQLPPGLPVHPGIHGLLHPRHLRDFPARNVLGAHDGHRRDDRRAGDGAHVGSFPHLAA